jgi:signal transduction histidine kinase
VALVWRQADETEREQAAAQLPAGPWLAPFLGGGRLATVVRLLGGAALVLIGFAFFFAFSGGLRAAGEGLLGTAVVLLGLALMIGPWALRSWRALAEERRERIRSQTRADFAAHLHDSVLQTLALIQKYAGDPREVVRLSRRQERELRGFLYGDGVTAEPETATFAAALKAAAAAIEDAHGVPIEVVTVRDRPVDERIQPLLAAAREAMLNAVRHSGAAVVDVYAEAEPTSASVFVRDRGKGFDLAAVPDDRLGVRSSIIGRMQRHGGTAEVRSEPGAGTEVRLEMEGAGP